MKNGQKNDLAMNAGVQKDGAPTITVLLVDDHTIVREGLRSLLEREPQISVIGEAADGYMAVQKATQLLPDVVVMDISMPGLNGVDATSQITAQAPRVKVIALSMHSQTTLVNRMLHAGAQGFLLKECAAKDLAAAIFSVMAHQFYFSAGIADSIRLGFKRSVLTNAEDHASDLNLQQHELLQLLAEGKNTKQIAECLKLSPKTVDLYRRRLMEKLRLYSIAELTKYAIREGVTSLDC
jgi:DNA-binding NarL/FixJ family response regulator